MSEKTETSETPKPKRARKATATDLRKAKEARQAKARRARENADLGLTKEQKAAVAAGEQELVFGGKVPDPHDEPVIWNDGQQRVLDTLKDESIREVLIAAGSRSGKTFLIVSIIVTQAILFPGSRHLIARKYFNGAKASIWLDTLPKVVDVLVKALKPLLVWNNTDFFLKFPNGSEIWVAGLDDKDRVDKILGREYMTIFFNEASEISYDVYTTVSTRLAQKCERSYVPKGKKLPVTVEGVNRVFIDENPPSSKHWTKVLFVDKLEPESRNKVRDPDKYTFLQIHPWENKANLSKDYLDRLMALPESKRRRFYDGKFGDDSQYALWATEQIAKNRVFEAPPLRRIVVAIDPAVSKKDTSDETGIVVRGIGFDNHLYLLEDLTGKYSPTEWAETAVGAYHKWQADCVVAEVNNGGDLVEAVIRTVDRRVPYKGVHATRDKYTRAEPVAALCAQGLDHHVGEFPELEDEQTTWEGKKGEPSPNRIDALVWATAELLPEMHVWRGGQIGGNFAAAMRGNYVPNSN